jgi:hypothetical protein
VTPVDWCSGAREHKGALERFICADPEREKYVHGVGKVHPRPWQIEVQSYLRGLKLPVASGSGLYLGMDADGVVAAVEYGFASDSTLGADLYLVAAIATACRARGQGHGGAALDLAVGSCVATNEELDLRHDLLARIHAENAESRGLFSSRGFAMVDVVDDLELWVLEL